MQYQRPSFTSALVCIRIAHANKCANQRPDAGSFCYSDGAYESDE